MTYHDKSVTDDPQGGDPLAMFVGLWTHEYYSFVPHNEFFNIVYCTNMHTILEI